MGPAIKRVVVAIGKVVVGLATVGGLIGLYYQFTSAPNIGAQMTSETNVLDVHQPVATLQVVFQGRDIQQTGQNLKIYHVTFTNTGTTDITQSDFDQNTDWGIQVEGGSIVEARILNADSDYLTNNINPQVDATTSMVKFNKVVFDRGASFTIELVVLHDKNTLPTLYRIGKIAGVKDTQSIISQYIPEESLLASVISGIFHGSLLVVFVRFILYAVVSIGLFFVGIIIYVKSQEARTRAKQAPQAPQQPKG